MRIPGLVSGRVSVVGGKFFPDSEIFLRNYGPDPAKALIVHGNYYNQANTQLLNSDHGGMDVYVRKKFHQAKVSCGGHQAITCEMCTIDLTDLTDHGSGWCNGDCSWRDGKCSLT